MSKKMMIWDGVKFRSVKEPFGSRMISEGKAQDMATTGGTKLKRRDQLVPMKPKTATYKNRMATTEVPNSDKAA